MKRRLIMMKAFSAMLEPVKTRLSKDLKAIPTLNFVDSQSL